MQRVRRDEAKAAAEEKARADRATLADNEDRVRRMQLRRDGSSGGQQGPALFEQVLIGTSGLDTDDNAVGGEAGGSSAQRHVNLFAELEAQERKNLAVGNKDYAAEKKKERDEWESKMGMFLSFSQCVPYANWSGFRHNEEVRGGHEGVQ